MQNKKLSNDYGRYSGMPYGDMDIDLLIKKYDQSNISDETLENRYDQFARQNIMDRRGDQNLFEHEKFKPRNPGRLQLQYNGHRGDAEFPYEPERFIGFDDHESPYGTDVSQLRKQHEARGRFQRFQSDDTTGQVSIGGYSQQRAQRDRDTMFGRVRKIKVFDRSLDGRTAGQRLLSKKTPFSAIDSELTKDKHEKIEPDTVVRRVVAMAKEIMHGDVESLDAEMFVADYSQVRRNAQPGDLRVKAGESSMAFGDASNTTIRKAIAFSMADVATTLAKNSSGESDFQTQSANLVRKQAAIHKLNSVLETTHSTQFGSQTKTAVYKTGTPNALQPLETTTDHTLPIILAAQMIRKMPTHGDLRAIIDDVAFDAKTAETFGEVIRKRGVDKAERSQEFVEDADRIGENQTVISYKNLHGRITGPSKESRTDQKSTESDKTQSRKTGTASTEYQRETSRQIQFGNNDKIERFGGRVGRPKVLAGHRDIEASIL